MSVKDCKNYIQMLDEHVITSTTDTKGTITSVSKAFCIISGYSQHELVGKSHNIVRHPDMPTALYDDLWTTIKQGKAWSGEIKNLKKDGGFYWVKVHIHANFNALGSIIGYSAVRQDITDQKLIEVMMHTDELTQVYNRRYFNQQLEPYIKKHRANGFWIGFLMIDADNFKKYNDSYGHHAGDDVLRTIGSSLTSTFNQIHDLVFRLGGEEFCVMVRATNPHEIRHRAEQARQHFQDVNISHSGNPPFYCVTLSMGLMGLNPGVQYASDEIYKYADEALYRAKQKGRNQVEVVSANVDIELF
ncbi:sensor domain-containing diguanylate cyclase [Thiomicrorhabdus aquaedulcis]|uniref:sensor domain-containing diguanylate cyclase n=1 Tax=Thiomicrorhabdus aquaedulcis TaxID=2211106 RepID=UPI000FD96163|nr:sensor domain-containing diguanylate cyclase [Thiomicrorhabdus aquaedulcis]